MARIGTTCLVIMVGVSGVALAGEAGIQSNVVSGAGRAADPVVLRGGAFPEMTGYPIDDLALFRYDPDSLQFVAVPFQIDERLDKVFNPGEADQFTESIYDIQGEEDGLLDADDELVFLFQDAGPRAPVDATWPADAEGLRFEICAIDSRPSAPTEERWVYLYHGVGLPRSETHYLTWDTLATTGISTDVFVAGFVDRWLVTGFRIFPPCGSGADLLDRFKGRADTGSTNQSEETWNGISTYLGGIVGPVRAIRYVRGAASGINTIHHDIVYQSRWERHFNIRVHPIVYARLYFDWLPLGAAEFYSPRVSGSQPVDGVPDVVGTEQPAWNLLRSAEGGLVVIYDLPPSPLYSAASQYYVDDVDHDDAVGDHYPDEDDAAYGNHGITLNDMANSHANAIPLNLIVFPLCADAGDETVGQTYSEFVNYPMQRVVISQRADEIEIHSLRARRDQGDVVLDWQPVATSTDYEVYASEFADVARQSWTLLGTTSATTYRDVGAVSDPRRFYDVRPILEVTP